MPPRFLPTVLCVLRATAIDSHSLQCRSPAIRLSLRVISTAVACLLFGMWGWWWWGCYLSLSHNRRLPKNVVEGRGRVQPRALNRAEVSFNVCPPSSRLFSKTPQKYSNRVLTRRMRCAPPRRTTTFPASLSATLRACLLYTQRRNSE